ncbi:MAG: hypothetical protein CBD77_04575 [bacterium TMED217]|nr:MAG: hypothetical protein CBD77_04575 [bacterium TMED217]|tara:strand:- start:18697 stop:19029 length:333 start_codon:yes stop_codon:yes gene_type:complete
MLKKILILFILTYIYNNKIIANNIPIIELEKRIFSLERQVAELKNESINKFLDNKWKNLKKGLNKNSIKNDIGNPDRIGKYSNGDEIWGFKKFTLKFNKNGILESWTKPF